MAQAPHLPVLYKTIITALQPKSPGRYIDGTLGAAGHAAGILTGAAPEGELLGLDLDPQALAIARETLAPFGGRAHIVQASYTTMKDEAAKLGWDAVDGIVLDFGVSSMQLDTPERGFSFLSNGPLDMRFSPNATLSAADLVNSFPEEELADIIFRYGEDRLARRIARSIVGNRPIHTTKELADLILKSIGKREHIHPATRTFQALRIAVNEELNSIENVLPIAVSLLRSPDAISGRSGGRLAVISFHSLEDRIVKEYFRHESRDCICPPRQPICTCGHKASITEINRKPIEADEEETKENSRARSAKLRIAQKI
ncbi:MAG: 16S rRNA (cytosine(1402)-N(4))-methyltransferase RsmH [Anaerolineales bacterium]